MFNKNFLVLLILLFFHSLFADTFRGRVINGATKAPVIGANIIIEGVNYGSVTDNDGNFILKFNSDKVKIIITHVGFEEKSIEIISREKINIELVPKSYFISPVLITSTRAVNGENPTSFSNIDKNFIKQNHTVEDIPDLISIIPSVDFYNESGGNTGYSYVKIRGFDQKRISVLINDVPINDPEDHNVYWVDLADLSENTEDIQVQRGIGSFDNGKIGFGGNINILTKNFSFNRKINFYTGVGSFNTRKFSGGMNVPLNYNLVLNTNFSFIQSDNYRRGSDASLYSYFVGMQHIYKKSITKVLFFGGHEKTGLAYNGIPEDIYKKDRRYNDLYEKYDNFIDNFSQFHFQLSNKFILNKNLFLENKIFYVYGNGYYEQFKDGIDDDKRFEYSLELKHDQSESELVRRKYVTKGQLGLLSSFNYTIENFKVKMGINFWNYASNHYGKVIQLDGIKIDHKYYDYDGKKNNLSFYTNFQYILSEKLNFVTGITLNLKNYTLEQNQVGNFKENFLNKLEVDYKFLNPSFGINYILSEKLNFYFSYSKSYLEPSDDDLFDTWYGPDDLGVHPLFKKRYIIRRKDNKVKYILWKDPVVKEEDLNDFELGANYSAGKFVYKLNFYYMKFNNEIVPMGGIDEDGYPIKGNAPETVHKGIEFSALYTSNKLYSMLNFSLSSNYFKKFVQYNWKEDWSGAEPVNLSNKKIPLFPSQLLNFLIGYKVGMFDISLKSKYVGRKYLDGTEDKSKSLNAYFVNDFIMNVNIKNVLFIFKINNIFDVEYETNGYYYYGNYYFPGPPRNFFAGVRIDF